MNIQNYPSVPLMRSLIRARVLYLNCLIVMAILLISVLLSCTLTNQDLCDVINNDFNLVLEGDDLAVVHKNSHGTSDFTLQLKKDEVYTEIELGIDWIDPKASKESWKFDVLPVTSYVKIDPQNGNITISSSALLEDNSEVYQISARSTREGECLMIKTLDIVYEKEISNIVFYAAAEREFENLQNHRIEVEWESSLANDGSITYTIEPSNENVTIGADGTIHINFKAMPSDSGLYTVVAKVKDPENDSEFRPYFGEKKTGISIKVTEADKCYHLDSGFKPQLLENDEQYYDISHWKELLHLSFYNENSNAESGLPGMGDKYKVSSDIVLPHKECEKSFTPIGRSTPFAGEFNGNSKTISGLYIENQATHGGLFSTLDSDSANQGNVIVHNLNISDPYIETKAIAGALAGYLKKGTVKNVHVKTKNSGDSGRVSTLGGFDNTKATIISNKLTDVELHGFTGGLIGVVGTDEACATPNLQRNARVDNSSASIMVEANYSTIGGLVGYLACSGLVLGYSTGEVKAAIDGSSNKSVSVGGLVGMANSATIKGYATGNVSGHSLLGGLVGNSYSSTIKGYATGEVKGKIMVGGLVGLSEGSTVTGYATGTVYGEGQAAGSVGSVGGLLGESISDKINGYALGSVVGRYVMGGLIGQTSKDSKINGYARGTIKIIETQTRRNFGRLIGTLSTQENTDQENTDDLVLFFSAQEGESNFCGLENADSEECKAVPFEGDWSGSFYTISGFGTGVNITNDMGSADIKKEFCLGDEKNSQCLPNSSWGFSDSSWPFIALSDLGDLENAQISSAEQPTQP